ncbi:MAG TPA: hypothetical protein VNO32_52290 [Candidatus Acidoferrum sp.]|jgi:hypothetical protein|nr:hypothetical protein [Candidatus Acidoferrum sp.]
MWWKATNFHFMRRDEKNIWRKVCSDLRAATNVTFLLINGSNIGIFKVNPNDETIPP